MAVQNVRLLMDNPEKSLQLLAQQNLIHPQMNPQMKIISQSES